MLAVTLCAALAACSDLPRPFQPAEKSFQAWSAPGDIAWGSILVPPIAGLPAPVSAALTDEVVEALQVREVPASAHTGGRGSIVLAGQVSAVTRKLRWTLLTPDGETALRFEEPLPDAARIGDSAPDLAAIAARAARRITAALEPPEIEKDVARSAAPVVLEGVRGAPGDGGIALARAMRHSLARIGIAVADEKDEATRLISGRVSVLQDQPETDDAAVTIAWDVLRPDGTRLGTVSQSNRVSLEQLTGAWGALAPIVARAGAPGIAQLLAQTETPRFAEAPRRRTPVAPPIHTPAEASPAPPQPPTEASLPTSTAQPIDPPIALAVEARPARPTPTIEARATPPEPAAEAPPTPLFRPLPVPPSKPRPEAPIAVTIMVSVMVQ
ncbi:MAG: hypothetical protein OXI57_09400 [Rhodospirillales bacterium]|nr:hypothetical protein [Rhodospirillales bacterium]